MSATPKAARRCSVPRPTRPSRLSGNLLDVGEIVAEQLSLAADPYPRRPGAKLEDVLPKPRGGGRKGRPSSAGILLPGWPP